MSTTDQQSYKNGDDRVLIYALLGSQYVAKVLTALDARKIPHEVMLVSLNRKKRNLPSGGYLVPEMMVTKSASTAKEPVVVAGSEDILHWLDDHYGTRYFPDQLASDASERASDGVLAGAVLYYNWVDPEGYERSMKKTIVDKTLPSWMPFKGPLTDALLKSTRASFRPKAAKMMGIDESELADEPRVRTLLLDELAYFQSLLREPSNTQSYLLGQESTAADFSVYGQLDRMVGHMGDAKLCPSLPDLVTQEPQLNRFWEWHSLMQERHPIRYKGKRGLHDSKL